MNTIVAYTVIFNQPHGAHVFLKSFYLPLVIVCTFFLNHKPCGLVFGEFQVNHCGFPGSANWLFLTMFSSWKASFGIYPPLRQDNTKHRKAIDSYKSYNYVISGYCSWELPMGKIRMLKSINNFTDRTKSNIHLHYWSIFFTKLARHGTLLVLQKHLVIFLFIFTVYIHSLQIATGIWGYCLKTKKRRLF